ncbi:50S ribosomal subunit protein L1 [Candidatus Vidania fulgoroideae]|nr:50S ribosomal subunit protein L1 [Candidatus Vidania fulgoroideae]
MFNKKEVISFLRKKKYNFSESFDLSFDIKNKTRIINSGFLCLPKTFKKKKRIAFLFSKNEQKNCRDFDKIKLILIKKNLLDNEDVFKLYKKGYLFVLSSFTKSLMESLLKKKIIKKIFKKSFFFRENFEKNIESLLNGSLTKYKFDKNNSVKFSFANSSMMDEKILLNLEKSITFFSNVLSNINVNFKKQCKIFLNTTQSKKSFLIKSYE